MAMDHLPSTGSDALVGFLIVEKTSAEDGFIAAWMVADSRGYPLEFRATTPVRPSVVQRTLYGSNLERYVGVELCGKQLIQQSQRKPALILVPTEDLLELSTESEANMIAIWRSGDSIHLEEEGSKNQRGALQSRGAQLTYSTPKDAGVDEAAALGQLEECIASFDPSRRSRECRLRWKCCPRKIHVTHRPECPFFLPSED